ncbi:hypothetical protein OS493_011810 [Desmophyllum pertusum]|uniref:Uncharacterized protein n=1 Tax=Desmophyllum pertusum TaxID=174260 RepID=A0A9X0CFS6_9CNID|nr:hypothetical protein OS493_011810 [Desmophyllum pertusum]
MIAIMFFLIWRKRYLKHQRLPIILQELNSPDEEHNGAPSPPVRLRNGHLTTGTQRESFIPLIQRNSSYRSQLSSSTSGGTILTYADDLFEDPLMSNGRSLGDRFI